MMSTAWLRHRSIRRGAMRSWRASRPMLPPRMSSAETAALATAKAREQEAFAAEQAREGIVAEHEYKMKLEYGADADAAADDEELLHDSEHDRALNDDPFNPDVAEDYPDDHGGGDDGWNPMPDEGEVQAEKDRKFGVAYSEVEGEEEDVDDEVDGDNADPHVVLSDVPSGSAERQVLDVEEGDDDGSVATMPIHMSSLPRLR